MEVAHFIAVQTVAPLTPGDFMFIRQRDADFGKRMAKGVDAWYPGLWIYYIDDPGNVEILQQDGYKNIEAQDYGGLVKYYHTYGLKLAADEFVIEGVGVLFGKEVWMRFLPELYST